MTSERRVPIRFRQVGATDFPTVDFALKVRGSPARLFEAALIDTGSHVTVLSEELLKQHGFPTARAKRTTAGIEGLGGHTESHYLENVVLALQGPDFSLHPVDLTRIQFVRRPFPPVLGRDVLEGLNAILHIAFGEKTGYIEIG